MAVQRIDGCMHARHRDDTTALLVLLYVLGWTPLTAELELSALSHKPEVIRELESLRAQVAGSELR